MVQPLVPYEVFHVTLVRVGVAATAGSPDRCAVQGTAVVRQAFSCTSKPWQVLPVSFEIEVTQRAVEDRGLRLGHCRRSQSDQCRQSCCADQRSESQSVNTPHVYLCSLKAQPRHRGWVEPPKWSATGQIAACQGDVRDLSNHTVQFLHT